MQPASPSAGRQERPPTPYPLTPGTIGLWLRRGEGLGRAARRATMTITTWRRHAADNLPTDRPAEPG